MKAATGHQAAIIKAAAVIVPQAAITRAVNTNLQSLLSRIPAEGETSKNENNSQTTVS